MFCGLKIQNGHHCRSRFNIGPYGKMIKKTFTEKITRMIIGCIWLLD
jgi:hypothetical protein